MNAQQAIDLRQQYLDLASLVRSKLPKTIEADSWDDDKSTYELYHVDLVELTAHYSRYIGCGDYERTSTKINLNTLLEQT